MIDDENSVDSSFKSADSELNGSIVERKRANTRVNKSYEERMKTKKAILEWKRKSWRKSRRKRRERRGSIEKELNAEKIGKIA